MFDIRRNNGLIETLCVAFSFFMLDQLAGYAKKKNPLGLTPKPFIQCREGEIAHRTAPFPAEVRNALRSELWQPLSLYLRCKRSEQDTQPYGVDKDYRLSVLGARVLTAKSVPWADFVGFGGKGAMLDSLASQEVQWRVDLEALSPDAQHALRRLGRGASTDFLVATFSKQACDTVPWVWGGFWFREKDMRIWLVEFPKRKRAAWEKKMASLHPKTVRWEDATS